MITSPMRWRIRSRVLLPVVCAPHSIQGHFPRHLSPTALDNPHAQIFCFLRNTRKNLNSHLCFPFTTNHLRTNGVHSVRGAEVSCERRGQHCSINRSQRNRALPCSVSFQPKIPLAAQQIAQRGKRARAVISHHDNPHASCSFPSTNTSG
jgi:hypothetical protein